MNVTSKSSASNIPLPVVNRCGDCTACCTVTAIAELDKDAYQDCPHLIDQGCGQYEQRPQVCQRFECMYRSDGWGNRPGGELMRPDRCGLMVLGFEGPEGEHAIRVCEVFDGALEGEVSKQLIPALLQQGYGVEIHQRGRPSYFLKQRGKS